MLKMITVFWPKLKPTLEQFDGSGFEDVETIEYDEPAAEVYCIYKDGSKKKVTTLGNGSQALLMLFLSSIQ